MSRLLKSFDELSLELVATDTIADRTVSLQLLASRPQVTSPGAANPLVQPTGRSGAPFADTDDGWHHGGINE